MMTEHGTHSHSGISQPNRVDDPLEGANDDRCHDVIPGVLAAARAIVDKAVAGLRERCRVGATIDVSRLDANQVVAYEIALSSAELLAAETAIASLSDSATALDRQLALAFAARAVRDILQRMEASFIQLSLELISLRELATNPAWSILQRESMRPDFLADAAQALARCDLDSTDIGAVQLDESSKLAQSSFRRFAADAVAPLAENIHRRDETVPEALVQSLRDMGVFGLSIPERYGGGQAEDGGSATMLVVTEALSEASLAAAGSLITRPEIVARMLLAGGTEQQKDHWLPRLASGDPLCAVAITEPDAGSDVARLMLKATRSMGGWLLNGSKTWCTLAGKAGVVMVVARTNPDRSSGHRGLSVFLAEKPTDDKHQFLFLQGGGGRLSGKAIATIGYRGMHSFDLTFEDFFVPDANLVGGEAGLGRGFLYTMVGMAGGRLQTAARAVGVMRAALRAAVKHAGDRVVFGAPLATFQLTQSKLVRMAAELAACRQLAFAAGRAIDRGGGRLESSMAKFMACRAVEWVTREAMQIHGGMGYAEESAVSRYFIDARVLSIFEGAEETLALKVVARGLVEAAARAADAEERAT